MMKIKVMCLVLSCMFIQYPENCLALTVLDPVERNIYNLFHPNASKTGNKHT